jgi:hypothetical protein
MMKFDFVVKDKKLIFNSGVNCLKVGRISFIAGRDGRLIYDQTIGIKSSAVELQMSTNTSTLIPALRILELPYNKYFDEKTVVNSQNDITFYWGKSKLAAYYNKFSTDDIEYEKRKPVIKKAVKFLIENEKNLPLKEEYLKKVTKPCKLLGFFEGFPIFDSNMGFAQLQSRLGVHVGNESVAISTPMNKYEKDVYELAGLISKKIKQDFSKKKNRAVFKRTVKINKLLGVFKFRKVQN